MQVEVEKLIRLLIVDEGLHKAEQITSSLRAAGVQVRAEFAEDAAGMCEMLETKTLDLVLFSLDLADFTLKQAHLLIQESGRHVSLVAMARNPGSELLIQSIQDGAQDVVSLKNLDHLFLVIKREALSLSWWRKAARTELELQESEKRCQSLLANSMDAVAYVHGGMYIYANAVYLELFGYADFEAIEGTPIIDMIDSSQQSKLKKLLQDLNTSKNKIDKLDLKLIQSNGDMVPATVEFSKANYDGEPCILVLIRSAVDTTELEEQITYLHQHDLVTGLYNRQNFMDRLKSSITQAMNGIHQSAVVYFAIDNFQSIRDMVGISGCDILIGDIAKLISENAPKGQIVARYGAASYACLGIVKEKSMIEEFATSILALVEERVFEIGEQSISATCSASICFVDENSPNNANRIIARAEKTCDQIQIRGGNQSGTYIPKADDMTKKEADGITIDLIKDALSHNRIAGFYQPIVSIKAASGERYIASLELWAEDGEKFYEKNYRRAAERSGTAQTLDRWLILHAIKKIAEINKSSSKVEFFITLGVGSVLDESLAPWISESLDKAGVAGEQLIFMINEGHAVSHLKAAKALFLALKGINCQLGLDDFGTGISPFQLIKHFQADYVRINVAYLENLAQNGDNQESIREFASQATSMNIRSITPGVEDAAILSVLWTLGIDFVQGDFLQRPEQVLNYDFSSLAG
jgi:diguanylate cyclase (GGDEF)-like protein/PAS domain S-box-containing protein